MEDNNESQENIIDEHITTVSYVANKKGDQELVSSTFWQPVNVVNHQAWVEIDKQIECGHNAEAEEFGQLIDEHLGFFHLRYQDLIARLATLGIEPGYIDNITRRYGSAEADESDRGLTSG